MSTVRTPKQSMRVRPDAQELRPDELIQLRRMLSTVAEVDDHMKPAEVALKLGLNKRVVLELARSGEFDGAWGTAFRLDHNTVRIPKRGVLEFQRKHALATS